MPATPLRSVLQAVLSGARQELAQRTDAELLAAFASVRDEAAFAELVRRHGRLVRGTARRTTRRPAKPGRQPAVITEPDPKGVRYPAVPPRTCGPGMRVWLPATEAPRSK